MQNERQPRNTATIRPETLAELESSRMLYPAAVGASDDGTGSGRLTSIVSGGGNDVPHSTAAATSAASAALSNTVAVSVFPPPVAMPGMVRDFLSADNCTKIDSDGN